MQIVPGRRYRVVVRFPWGERFETVADRVVREEGGSLRWEGGAEFGHEPCLETPIREAEDWVLGWCGGCCDVTVVISWGPGAPEP